MANTTDARRPEGLPGVIRIVESTRRSEKGTHIYLVGFVASPPSDHELMRFIKFVQRRYPQADITILKSKAFAQIICNDPRGDLLRWLQVNLEPQIPYTCVVHEGTKASNHIVIEVRGKNHPEAVATVARRFNELNGLTHVSTSGARITYGVAAHLANDHHELGKVLQGGQRLASVTMTIPLL